MSNETKPAVSTPPTSRLGEPTGAKSQPAGADKGGEKSSKSAGDIKPNTQPAADAPKTADGTIDKR